MFLILRHKISNILHDRVFDCEEEQIINYKRKLTITKQVQLKGKRKIFVAISNTRDRTFTATFRRMSMYFFVDDRIRRNMQSSKCSIYGRRSNLKKVYLKPFFLLG